ncbi:MAG: hypothetical protein ABJF88_19565 [Rhodothermales bacterium]
MNIIRYIDRVLWATRMGSITTPTHWGRCSHCDETLPWVTPTQNGDLCCTRCGHDQSHPSNG